MIAAAYHFEPTEDHVGDPKYQMSVAIPDFTEVRFSYLAGVAFTVTHAVANLFAGVIADNISRKWFLGVCSVVWSLTSVGIGFSRLYWQLFVMRFLLGLFEAALNPCAYSLISDYFPPQMQTQANAVNTVGKYLGYSMQSMSIILLEMLGWRVSYIIVGIYGVVVGLAIIFFVFEPLRGKYAPAKHGKQTEPSKQENFMRKTWKGFVSLFNDGCCFWVILGISLRQWQFYAMSYYSLQFFNIY